MSDRASPRDATYSAVLGPYRFEPHNGFGGKDFDGEPLPFGYISTHAPQPIFELRVILDFPRGELAATALLLAEAPALRDALKALLLSLPKHWLSTPQARKAKAALAKAEREVASRGEATPSTTPEA